ncbi:MAG: omptin family outer membrane protease [Treponema sp.]|jgi:outer membrane protease|nr:omptin family outer membrane protease [Treponema sp.]
MKSIAGFSCFVILVCTAVPAFGEINLLGQPYAFSLSAGPGIIYGTAYEIVYRDSASNDYLSELQWELKPLWYLGLNVSFGPREILRRWGISAALAVKAGLPLKTGTMEDRDWMDCTVPGSLTHFSSHDNKTQAAVLVDLDFAFSLPFKGRFFFKPLLSLDYVFLSMEARNGYIQYGPNYPSASRTTPYEPWSSSWEKEAMRGTGITYIQHWILLSPGIGFGAALGPVTLEASFKITPAVLCITIDNHILREIVFTDYMAGGLALEPALDVSVEVTKNVSLGLAASYRHIVKTRGNDVVEEEGKDAYTVPNVAGAGLQLFDGGLYVKVRL